MSYRTHFCCGCSMRHGAMFVAIYTLAFALIYIVYEIIHLCLITESSIITAMTYINFAVFIPWTAGGTCLLLATIKEKSKLVLVWLVASAVAVIVTVLGIFLEASMGALDGINHFNDSGLPWVAVSVFGLAGNSFVQIFFIARIWVYRKEVQKRERQKAIWQYSCIAARLVPGNSGENPVFVGDPT